MSSDMISHLITAATFIVGVLAVVGLPALAVVVVRFLKFKERELTIEMEYRQKSQHQLLAFEQRMEGVEERVQRMEDPELLEGPAAPDARRQPSLDTSRGTKAR